MHLVDLSLMFHRIKNKQKKKLIHTNNLQQNESKSDDDLFKTLECVFFRFVDVLHTAQIKCLRCVKWA